MHVFSKHLTIKKIAIIIICDTVQFRLARGEFMKKLICIFLCVSIVFSFCHVSSYAVKEKSNNPTILISGFLCSQLYFDYGTEKEENIWKALLKKAAEIIGDDFLQYAKSFAGLAVGKTEEFGDALGEGAKNALKILSCSPDGSSAYPISHYSNNPATSNLEYMYKNGLKDKLYEKNFCKYLSEISDPSKIYCFQYDSRTDAITLAEQLHTFINSVREYNNADKVNIFALSFGGLITSTYLTLFESENAVERVVLSVPAIGGTNIPDRLFRGEINLAAEDLIKFAETIMQNESNFARIF